MSFQKSRCAVRDLPIDSDKRRRPRTSRCASDGNARLPREESSKLVAKRLMRVDGGRTKRKRVKTGKQGKTWHTERRGRWREEARRATRGREGSAAEDEGWKRERCGTRDGGRGEGGWRSERLPRLKWNIDLRRRAQPLQPTRPCPPFSAGVPSLWTPPK